MKYKMSLQRLNRVSIVLFVVFSIIVWCGCSVVGRTVPADKRIQLAETGRHEGKWRNGGLKLHYDYRLNPPYASNNVSGSMEISGSVGYGFGAQERPALEALDVWIDFLDREETILVRNHLYGGSGNKIKWFAKSYEVPPEAVGFSFAHMAIHWGQIGDGAD